MADETVIIGGGPTGLAVAAQLGQRGRPHQPPERVDTLAADWRGRYDSLQPAYGPVAVVASGGADPAPVRPVGARSMAHFEDNLGATGWALTHEQVETLKAASPLPDVYPTNLLSRFQRRPA